LLALTAHPDDEGFGLAGTMARYAADGWQITLVCATRGEVGEISDPALATPETLPAVREQELRDACADRGVNDVRFLEYRDSGMAGAAENADPRALSNADPETVIARYDALLRELRPTVVVTWDASGGYGHPDHISVHKHATEATRRAIDAGYGPAALYWMTAAMEKFAEIARALEAQGVQMISEEMRESMLRLPHVAPTTEIDVRAFLPQKLASMARHRTQMAEQGPFTLLPPDLRDAIMATEHFHGAIPPLPEGAPEEHALFAGAQRR
jgi:LmbE family N-acetylglucosaminyl deacetylase